jgi:hypothetical protein
MKVLNTWTIQDTFSGSPWSLRHGDDEDEDTGTEAEAEPGGGARRHQPEG